MIIIESKRKKPATILKKYPDAILADVTSGAKDGLVKLSPFYPHGGIPVPFSEGYTASCVEAIWQGLKVFEGCDVDTSLFTNDTMKGLKRTVRKYGKPLGHRKGVNGSELLGYIEARKLIYIPTYKWVLDNVPEVHNVIMRIKERSKDHDIVFLDYNTNTEFRDTSSPLSHAGLVKLYIEGNYPEKNVSYTPLSDAEIKQRKNEIKENKKVSKRRNKSKVEQLNIFKNE